MALPPNATSDGGLTGLALHGPVNSAHVVGPSDVGACKAYVTMVDAVLLPFDPATLPAATQGASPVALGAALGAPQCGLQANARINTTDVIRDGTANRQHTGARGREF